MKNILKISVMYIVFGLVIGLTTHEIAYWTNFSGETVLSFVHAHVLILGGGVFLMVPVLMKVFQIEQQKGFKGFLWAYNLGLLMTLGFMSVRGFSELLEFPLGNMMNHMVGGLAGIGHVILTVGVFLFFKALFRAMKECA